MDPSGSSAERSHTEMKEEHQRHRRHHHRHPSSTTKKKSGSLPLIMFLSMDDEESARPDCANASNPFHKCTRHCSPGTKPDGKGSKKITSHANGAVARIGIGGGHERSVVVDAAPHPNSVNPLCPNSSNPFHVCVEACLQKIRQKDKSRDGVSRSRIPEKIVADKERKDGVQISERAVRPMCPYASNPFHVCAEACSQTIPAAKDGVKRFNPLGSKVPIVKAKKGEVKTASKGKVVANCKYASNPFHNCDKYCFQSGQGKFQVKSQTEKRKIIAKTLEENTSPSKVDAAIEKFLNNHSEEDLADEANSAETNEDVKGTEIIKIDAECRDETGGDIKRTEMRNVDQECIDATNIHNSNAEYGLQRIPEMDQTGESKLQLRNSSPVVLSGFMLVMIYMIHIFVIAIMHRRKK